jgi:hypothetical protein
MLEILVDRGLLFLPAMIPRLCLEDRLSAIPPWCFQPKAKRFFGAAPNGQLPAAACGVQSRVFQRVKIHPATASAGSNQPSWDD